MKTGIDFVIIVLASGLLSACQLNSESSTSMEDWANRSRPQTILEGTWTWEETVGSGVAGPYRSDSVTAGFSLHYVFGYNVLDTYKDGIKSEHFSYAFNASEKQEDQRLILTAGNGNKETLLWEIKSDESGTYLFLRNFEPCCDNTFEKRFRLIKHGDTGGSK